MHALSTTHPMSKITRLAISRKPLNQKKKKEKVHPSYIFLHLSANFGVKIQNTHRYRNWATFSTSHQLAHPSQRPSGEILKNPK